MNLAVFKALDDDALAALASKGLLRRAQKDLEHAAPERRDETDAQAVLFFVAENVYVSMPASGPQQAHCSCPAGSRCRHILAAALFLRDLASKSAAPAPISSSSPTPSQTNHVDRAKSAPTDISPAPSLPLSPSPSPSPQLLSLAAAELQKWAGRTLYRQGQDDLTAGLECTIEEAPELILFRFPAYNVVVRWIAGAGLEGMICSCKQLHTCRHRVAAVLAYQRRHTAPGVAPAPDTVGRAAERATDVPANRGEVLQASERLLVEIVAVGFNRLSGNTEGRLQTLADHVAWLNNRDVRADTHHLLRDAARTYALVTALRRAGNAPAALIGEQRSRYFDVGMLELVGLGAQQWRTRSGYTGLTVFFWDVQSARWATWTDARPVYYVSIKFDPREHYRHGQAWSGGTTPLTLSRSRVRLMNARRNLDYRLSSHRECQVLTAQPIDPPGAPDLPGLSRVQYGDWSALGQRLAAVAAGGLLEREALTDLVIVTPERWEAGEYDELHQCLLRPVSDKAGRVLMLTLPHETAWEFAVDTLAKWEPRRQGTWGILGRARLAESGLEVTPISLLNRAQAQAGADGTDRLVVNITLDAEGPAATPLSGTANETETATPPAPPPDEELPEEDEEEEQGAVGADAGSAVTLALDACATDLTYVAEVGSMAGRAEHARNLGAGAERLRQLGLTTCADALTALAGALASSQHTLQADPLHTAALLLRAHYVLHLAFSQAAVSAGLASVLRS
jgi:hypothetical protein